MVSDQTILDFLGRTETLAGLHDLRLDITRHHDTWVLTMEGYPTAHLSFEDWTHRNFEKTFCVVRFPGNATAAPIYVNLVPGALFAVLYI